jgi:perosamine synthetase
MIEKSVISEEDLSLIQRLIPGPDPILETPVRRISPEEESARLIPVADTLLDGNEARYLAECVQSNWISSIGPFVREFERQFAQACDCEFGVACANGTVALHLALATLGLGPGDEVIIPTFTMIATANAVSYTGATPVLVDAEPETWNMDVSRLEEKITPRVKAIVVVHTYGHPVEMNVVNEVAKRQGIAVIEDAAEAHGSEYHGRRAGSLGDAASFSFYANKIITTGEGGMVTTNNAELAEVARRLRDHAFSDERHFWHQYRGFNYRMTNMQAAIGLAQTERLPALIERRRRNARLYTETLSQVPGLTLPRELPDMKNVFWMYGVLVDEEFGCSRDELRRLLAQQGIETRTFFIPIHFQPIYFAQFKGQRYPVAETLCQKGLYLPSGAGLSESDVRFVAETVAQIQRRL